jgi:3-deoxy-D-manno-octulosonic-acid transferase
MKFLYILSVKIYSVGITLVSLFSKKAKYRYIGVRRTFQIIKQAELRNTIWFHCASLGEFEQGRSLIEKIKENNPETSIALSFFSPSGYEIRKNYEHADIVFYLPADSRKNAKKLIDLLNPKTVFYIKYEFWYFYLKEIHKRAIPLYLVSGIFRKDQIFFRSYGAFFRKMLLNFTHLFVQNKTSQKLLNDLDIHNVTITGDTRFDRVHEIAQSRKSYPDIEKFINNNLVLIAGSTWKPDEELLIDYLNKTDYKIKLIIAPHEIEEENIKRIIRSAQKKTLRYSAMNQNSDFDSDILIIDNIGMLSSLYAYGHIAYIGGGFGAGIHNTLEAAVFGMPIIFGPNFGKFSEAVELIKKQAAFSVSSKKEFFLTMEKNVYERIQKYMRRKFRLIC